MRWPDFPDVTDDREPELPDRMPADPNRMQQGAACPEHATTLPMKEMNHGS